jgi:hypothetical protein
LIAAKKTNAPMLLDAPNANVASTEPDVARSISRLPPMASPRRPMSTLPTAYVTIGTEESTPSCVLLYPNSLASSGNDDSTFARQR